jgi:hypothetical protein
MMYWKECGRKRQGTNLRSYHVTDLEEPRKTTQAYITIVSVSARRQNRKIVRPDLQHSSRCSNMEPHFVVRFYVSFRICAVFALTLQTGKCN